MALSLVIAAPYVRCGSTMLQHLCNQRPQTKIWGENTNLPSRFVRHAKGVKALSDGPNARTRPGWMDVALANPEPDRLPKATAAAFRAFCDAYYADDGTHDLIGFKQPGVGPEELELLRSAYPTCDVLLLVRDPRDVWVSFRGFRPEQATTNRRRDFCDEWSARVLDYKARADSDARMHVVRYEDVVAQTSEAVALLGNVAKLTAEQVSAGLSEKLNSTASGPSVVDDIAIARDCKDAMIALGY